MQDFNSGNLFTAFILIDPKPSIIQTAFSITAKPTPKFNFHTKQSITKKSLIFLFLLLIIVIISV